MSCFYIETESFSLIRSVDLFTQRTCNTRLIIFAPLLCHTRLLHYGSSSFSRNHHVIYMHVVSYSVIQAVVLYTYVYRHNLNRQTKFELVLTL
jgi:hypothetical protein